MKEIYELGNVYDGDIESEYYELEKDANESLEDEYYRKLNGFAYEKTYAGKYSLQLKHYRIKTDNFKEAIKLSNLDEQEVCKDFLCLNLEELDREISFREMEYLLEKMKYDEREKVFETINEEMPFSIDRHGKTIDKDYAYNFFKKDIIINLDYEFCESPEKDNFIQIFKETNDEQEFKEKIFETIGLMGGKIKPTDLGLNYKDFEQELTNLYESLETEIINKLIKDYVTIDSEEIENIIENLDDDTINKLKEIGEKIVDYRFKHSIVKGLEGVENLENQKFIENTINEIEDTEKDLGKLEEKVFNKDKYAEISKLIIESIKSMLLELVRDFQIELQILKEKFINKNNEEQAIDNVDNEKDTKSEIKINLTENDKIKMADIKELPESILVALSKEDNIRVLRKLAINENLPKEAFLNLAKNSDLKLKELLLENKNISSEALNVLIDDKDDFIKLETIKHKNLSSEKLNELYNKNIKNDEIIGYIAKNQNAPRELLEKIANNLKTTNENRKLAFQNKNHPINNKFIKPEISKEKSNELYQKLVFQSDIRKNKLLDMFRNEELYADEKGNAIFPIKNNNNEVVGAYKIDFSKNERPVLLENGNVKEEYLQSANDLSNKIFESLQQEEVVEQVEEIEIE